MRNDRQESPVTVGDYASYLRLEHLDNALNPISREPAEARFIRVHHIAEILFAQIIDELEAAISSLSSRPADIESCLTSFRRLRVLTDQSARIFELLNSLISASEFATFRGHLGSASGLQSERYWRIETLSRSIATQTPEEASGRVADQGANGELFPRNLWAGFLQVSGWDGNDLQDLSQMISGRNDVGRIASAMREYDLGWADWREKHAITVESMIGKSARGTGGSTGAAYLWSRVGLRFYPQLHQAASLGRRTVR